MQFSAWEYDKDYLLPPWFDMNDPAFKLGVMVQLYSDYYWRHNCYCGKDEEDEDVASSMAESPLYSSWTLEMMGRGDRA